MVRLRPYKYSDAPYIINWVGNEFAFTQWCGDKFTYPLTLEKMKEYYHHYEKDENGWIMTAVDETGIPVGHLLMKRADYVAGSIHFGFVIVAPQLRGRGCGKEMVTLAVHYALDILNMKRITLGVFDNNTVAHHCYQSVGFLDEKYNENCFPFKDKKWGVFDMAIEKDYMID